MDKEFLQMFFIERKILPKGGDMQACIRVVFVCSTPFHPLKFRQGRLPFAGRQENE
jgi:hypothetical protein